MSECFPLSRKLFFHCWYEVLDLVVIGVSTLLTIVHVILDTHGDDEMIEIGLL